MQINEERIQRILDYLESEGFSLEILKEIEESLKDVPNEKIEEELEKMLKVMKKTLKDIIG